MTDAGSGDTARLAAPEWQSVEESFGPTGNPFVDTGLYAMLARARMLRPHDPPRALTREAIVEALGDGLWLARANRRLNSFHMVCLNSPLVNSSTNRRMKSDRGCLDPRDEGWQEYLAVLFRLRDEAVSLPHSLSSTSLSSFETLAFGAGICEACGERPATRVIERIGRDFFPFAGSLGNDAQALPAASRSPRICALCLLSIQWLPLGAQMYNGRLACFQFTDPGFSALAVEASFTETCSRLEAAASNERVPVAGSGEGARRAAIFLLDQMRRMRSEGGRESLPPHLALNIWSFSNAAAAPECEIVEIPCGALQFFHDAALDDYGELRELIEGEDAKKPQTHLLNCAARGRDYPGFYSRLSASSRSLVSKRLYDLYQTRVVRRSHASLAAAMRIAVAAGERFSPAGANAGANERRQRRRLASILDNGLRRDQGAKRELRAVCADLAMAGRLSLDEYVEIFPSISSPAGDEPAVADYWREAGRAVRASAAGWDVVWFCLHHALRETCAVVRGRDFAAAFASEGNDLAMFTHPKIRTFARHLFELHLEERGGADRRRGLEWIGSNLLERFRRNEVTTSTLREWFIRLAGVRPGYENEDWDSLCRDEDGREATDELRFQLQLELANLYRRAMNEDGR